MEFYIVSVGVCIILQNIERTLEMSINSPQNRFLNDPSLLFLLQLTICLFDRTNISFIAVRKSILVREPIIQALGLKFLTRRILCDLKLNSSCIKKIWLDYMTN